MLGMVVGAVTSLKLGHSTLNTKWGQLASAAQIYSLDVLLGSCIAAPGLLHTVTAIQPNPHGASSTTVAPGIYAYVLNCALGVIVIVTK